jgi:hypothetical protein
LNATSDMEPGLTEDQQAVLRLCCEAASTDDVLYWEAWFSAKDVSSRYATRENRREVDLAVVLQSLINQGYMLLPPVERSETDEAESGSLPTACQVAGLGFEKYAEATFTSYLDWVEQVGEAVSSESVSVATIADQLSIDPHVVAHIIHYHELL